MAKKNNAPGVESGQALTPPEIPQPETQQPDTVSADEIPEANVQPGAEESAGAKSQAETATQAESEATSPDPVDTAHHLELLDLMDKFKTDVVYENDNGEKFLSHNLAMLSTGQDRSKITTYHRKEIQPCAE